jgi:hypothetical protein
MGVAGEVGLGIVEFVEGAGLSGVLRSFLEAATAIRELHDRGEAHGSLTPETILAGESGVRLLRRPLSRDASYTAPEVLEGSAPDARSDIFAFGCVLQRVVLHGVRASYSGPSLDPLLTRCLARNPADRYQRMQQVITELKLLTIMERRHEWRGLPHVRRMETRIRTLISRVESLERRLEALAPEEAGAPHLSAAGNNYWFPGRRGRGWPSARAVRDTANRR